MVRKIRETLGNDVNLTVDGPRSLRYAQALKLAQELEALGVSWFEEPISPEDLEGYSVLAADVTMPIAMDESERTRYGFLELIQRKTVDIMQPDVSWVGELTEAKRIAELCYTANLAWVTHNWGTIVNTAASIHLVASMPDGFLAEYPGGPKV